MSSISVAGLTVVVIERTPVEATTSRMKGDSSTGEPGKTALTAFRGSVPCGQDFACADTMAELSNPPERQEPTFTSERMCRRMESRKSSRNLSAASPSLSGSMPGGGGVQ